MNDIAIKVENLGKMYRIGAEEQRPDGLWDATKQAVLSPFDYLRRITRPPTEEETLWALKDVSFEVERGEVVGIIGRNGAGKSTLLKVLSRITEPTEGRAVINGRVGSLLEVGTGFHPELTGRENIYLNGAILGMTRAEIDRKFDEIVAFSGVEKFIDTPVKRYSSGMRVRLGFSVAAHLDPEILLIDEVLAVGDMSFQRKCIGKMDDVAKSGRTVLFVSHNMSMISSLCSRCILLREGNLALMGNTEAVVEKYKVASSPNLNVPLSKRDDRRGSGDLRFTKLRVLGDTPEAGDEPGYVSSCQPVKFVVEYSTLNGEPIKDLDVAIRISSIYGDPLVTFNSRFQNERFSTSPAQGELICSISNLPLLYGTYRIDLWAGVRGVTADYIEGAGKLEVMEKDVFGTGRLPKRKKHGVFIVPFSWNLKDSR
jgi:lipopolysaccharide transport system ATP-binding protein